MTKGCGYLRIGTMPPLNTQEFRLYVPPAELEPIGLVVPCPDCLGRVARGQLPNPLHASCAAHIASPVR